MTTTLLIGGSSYIGRPLHFRLQKTMDVIATYSKTPVPKGIYFDALKTRLPDVIRPNDHICQAIILAAHSNPKWCWRNKEEAHELNINATKKIIDDLIMLKIKPIFLSSEAVFGGPKMQPFVEDDLPCPQFLYGKQKAQIEKYLKVQKVFFLNIRLARVFGFTANDLTGLEDWIIALRSQKPIKCATDQIMSPISLADAIEGIATLVEKSATGTFNLAGARPIKRVELLSLLVDESKKNGIASPIVQPCLLRDFTDEESRPLNSSMSINKVKEFTKYEPASYEALCRATAKCFNREP